MADKDLWDKADIVSKFFVPVVVAASVLWWNGDRTKSDRSATMTQIAIGVLSKEPDAKDTVDPLREWAISVLQNPTAPPVLSEGAAMQLRFRGLDFSFVSRVDAETMKKFEEVIREWEGRTQDPPQTITPLNPE